MAARSGGKGWIAFVLVNAIVTFFGLSYIFFPMGSVVADGNKTTGVLDVPREVWGTYVVVSAFAMLVVAVTGYRQGKAWAWYALLYQFVFFAVVVVVEPDPVTPVVFAVILGVVLWRSRSRFRATPAPARRVTRMPG